MGDVKFRTSWQDDGLEALNLFLSQIFHIFLIASLELSLQAVVWIIVYSSERQGAIQQSFQTFMVIVDTASR